MNKISPPKLPLRFFRWYCHPKMLHYIEGDLMEMYEKRLKKSGKRVADLRFVLDVLLLFRRGIIRPTEGYKNLNHYGMLKNNFKISFRQLAKNKAFTFINVAGLAFGLTCFFLIGLYLYDELTFDQHHQNFNQIYRLIEHKKNNTEDITIAAASYKMSEEALKSIGEIDNTARMTRTGRANLINTDTKIKFQETVAYANNGLVEMFDFETVEGDLRTALKEPNTIILVEGLAKKLFPKQNALGKILNWEFTPTPLKITAVIKDHPKNSSFNFTSLYSEISHEADSSWVNWTQRSWASEAFMVFYQLNEKSNPEIVSAKLKQLLYANFKPEAGQSYDFRLQPLKDIHLYSQNIIDGARNSNVETIDTGSVFYVKIFAGVALFVLVIACINYMNLTTAKSSTRAKEIGVKKAVGADRSHLAGQFLIESVLVACIAFVLSVILVNLLLPFFNEFTNKQLSLNYNSNWRIWTMAIATLIIAGLLSGSYPAFIMSRFNPLLLLKSMKVSNKSELSLRQSLVVFQFTVSIVLMVATIVIFQQVNYLNNKDLGFKKELLVVVDINSGKVRQGATTINTEFSKIPSVKNVSTTSRVPGEWKTIPKIKISNVGSASEASESYLLSVDENFMQTFEISLLQGRNFNSEGDSSSIMLNEAAAKMLNITEASGQEVEIPMRAFGGSFSPLNDNKVFKPKVIGIVKDFHFQTLREKIAPLVLAYQNNPVHVIDYFTSRIEAQNAPATIQKMFDILLKIDPEHGNEYHYLDEQLARFYAEDARRETILIWAAFATIFISCLGLFGLATYSAEQRIKEMGVRKVLGASVSSMVALISKDFLKLVLIANGIAFPLGWLAADKWLQEFAYRINIEWWVFALAGFLAIGIAIATISYQSIHTAFANPVKSLRSE